LSHVPNKVKPLVFNIASKQLYRFNKYKTNDTGKFTLKIYDKSSYSYSSLIKRLNYVNIARSLINEPANIATPEYICNIAMDLFKGSKTNILVYDEAEIKRKGLNLVWAVGKASKNAPRFLIMEHKVPGAKKTICLCGKGVTFDAGGLQIKTGRANSYEMKGDKTGGCIVMALLKYFTDTNFENNVIGVVPLVENIISSNVTHPGDIVKSYSGKTVEILDTDAEGRLILADALSFCEQYKPDYIFDLATLTGWSNNLHCDTSAIFYSPNNKLHQLIDEIGEKIGERTWGMPKWLDYMKYCKSTVADLKNYDFKVHGCSRGSGFMAAMFLGHFVPERCLKNWVHFDITNNVDANSMNANTMNLVIDLVTTLCHRKKQ
jgi:leucyl aminopeptidase